MDCCVHPLSGQLPTPGLLVLKMETTIVYWGYIRIMENTMETTIVEGGVGVNMGTGSFHLSYWGDLSGIWNIW